MQTITENRAALRYFKDKLRALEAGGYVRFVNEYEIRNGGADMRRVARALTAM